MNPSRPSLQPPPPSCPPTLKQYQSLLTSPKKGFVSSRPLWPCLQAKSFTAKRHCERGDDDDQIRRPSIDQLEHHATQQSPPSTTDLPTSVSGDTNASGGRWKWQWGAWWREGRVGRDTSSKRWQMPPLQPPTVEPMLPSLCQQNLRKTLQQSLHFAVVQLLQGRAALAIVK